jgi:3-hydroxyacyl-CoA dehydrogenase
MSTDLVSLAVTDGVALITLRNPPVNALSAAVRGGLRDAVLAAEADQAVRAIVLTGNGKMFCAGADISEFGKTPIPPSLPETIAVIEACAKPVVAAINGGALGGGAEIALGCHARIAAAAATIGLPEIKLGLLPGAGATQRLPRLIGPARAFKLMLDGNPITAPDALALRIIDEVAEGDVLAAATRKALALVGQTPRRSSAATEGLTDEERAAFEAAAASAIKREPQAPNVAALVDAVRAALDKPFAEGMAIERAHFMALLADDRSKALRHVFFAERAATRIAGLPRDTKARPLARAAVVGGGTMGGGIAMCFANAGIPVTIIETSDENLQRGLARVAQTYDISVKRGSLTQAARDLRMQLIDGKVGLEAAADADIVVEAAFEEMTLKQEIFGTLDRIAKPGAVLATNTSYLDVNVIAAATSRPQDVLGMHFFSPANVMKLLEVVRGEKTAPDVLATAVQLAPRLGKLPVVVGVCYGFVGNRMLAARTRQAERVLIEGALPQDVDEAITGFGFRMGPFAMADLAGLDIGWRIRRATGKTAPVADALCEAGRLGQKTGAGYFCYQPGDRTARPDPVVADIIASVAAGLGVTRHPIEPEAIVERLIYPMINEGARILEEGIAARPGDIDVVWLNGYGWPSWRGGPMYFADQVGLAKIAARLETFAAESGDASLAPAPLLRRLAEAGLGFASLSQG